MALLHQGFFSVKKACGKFKLAIFSEMELIARRKTGGFSEKDVDGKTQRAVFSGMSSVAHHK